VFHEVPKNGSYKLQKKRLHRRLHYDSHTSSWIADLTAGFDMARTTYVSICKLQQEPLPQCEGPKLHPFHDHVASIDFKHLLSDPATTAQSHVFEVSITSKPYALKIVSFSLAISSIPVLRSPTDLENTLATRILQRFRRPSPTSQQRNLPRSSRPPLRPHVSVPQRMPRCWADYPSGLKRQNRGALPWLSHCPRCHGGGARTALPHRRLRPAWQGVCAPERPATARETDADDCAFKHGRVEGTT